MMEFFGSTISSKPILLVGFLSNSFIFIIKRRRYTSMSKWISSKRRMMAETTTADIPAIEVEKTEKETTIQQITSNKLYFYSDVTRESIYILNRQIDELTRQLKVLQVSYNLEKLPYIELHVSSEGGDIFPAMASVDKILNNPIPINTYCEGIVASAATLLTVVGHKRYINKHSCMLIHQISSCLWGNYQNFVEETKNLDLIMNLIKRVYLDKTSFTQKDLDELLKHDFYLPAEECLNRKLVDKII